MILVCRNADCAKFGGSQLYGFCYNRFKQIKVYLKKYTFNFQDYITIKKKFLQRIKELDDLDLIEELRNEI